MNPSLVTPHGVDPFLLTRLCVPLKFLLFLQFLRDHSQNLPHQRHLREIKKNSQILAILNNSSYLCTQRRQVMISTVNTPSTEISTADALWVLIQSQTKAVQKALIQRILESQTSEKTKAQQMMVKESLTRAFDELHSGKVHHDARKLFSK